MNNARKKDKMYADLNLKLHRPLTQACADFYLLESLNAQGFKPAQVLFDSFQNELAEEFARYFEYACLTEIGYFFSSEGPMGGGSVTNCIRWCECYCDCGDYCCDCESCSCDCDTTCDSCYATNQKTSVSLDGMSVPEAVKEWKTRTAHNYSHYDSWFAWKEIRNQVGVRAISDMAEAFSMDGWSSSFGGHSWASIAQVVYDYRAKNIKPRLFVDRCWTLEHNGGCAFNKVPYHGYSDLMDVLETQAAGKYEFLLKRWASSKVRDVWQLHACKNDQRILRSPLWLGVLPDWYDLMEREEDF